jgi:hypothetical protein
MSNGQSKMDCKIKKPKSNIPSFTYFLMIVDLTIKNFILSLFLQPTLLKEVLLCNQWERGLYLVEAIFVDVCDIWNKSIFNPLSKGTMKSIENLWGEVE